MATIPMGIRARVGVITLTLTQIRCKWGRRVEFIINNFIPVLQFGINYCKFSPFFGFFFPFLFLLFFCSFFFALSSFHSFHSWSAGAFSPSDPAPWKGRVTHLRRAHQIYFWYSSAVESSVLGTVGPSRKCCPRKSGTPQERVARNPRKDPAGSSLSGWPQAPSGVPAVLFPFSREDVHRFPLRVRAVSPYRRKPQDPWGPSWPRLGSSREESRPCLEHWQTPESNWTLSFYAS